MSYKETMPSILHGMDSYRHQVPPTQRGFQGKTILAAIVLISVLVLYLR